jgi:signal transduction histidine kinase/DNA-binding NarL/FixJ family response regulator
LGQAAYGAAEEGFELVATDDRRVPVRISAGLTGDDQSESVCLVVSDISELKRAQEMAIASLKELAETRAKLVAQLECKNAELVVARDGALQASQAKSELLANVSHEIRTPLSSIIGLTAMLLDSNLTEEQAQLGRQVRENGESLLNIINDILDFSKMLAGKLIFRDIEFELEKVVNDALQMVRGDARRKGLETTVSIELQKSQTLRGDPGRLRQVLANLLTNAVKFTEHGGISIAVTSLADSPNELELRFVVSDTGVGIPEKVQAQLFRPFSQFDTSSRSASGTGLGLAIARGLVERMGGKIGLKSAPGAGSAFWFTAKFAKPISKLRSSSAVASSTAPASNTAAFNARRKFHVLVVEDSAANRKVTLWQLRKLGYTAEAVSNGREALEALAQTPYDLVLMDCRMPEMNGYEASRRIRQCEARGHHIKIVAITAHALPGDQQKCLEASMDDYVSKPVRIEDLSVVLDRLLRGHKKATEPALIAPHAVAEMVDSEAPALDPVMMASLRAQAGLLPDLIDTVLKEIPQELGSIDEAFERSNDECAAIAAHGLKGLGAIFGARRMQELASNVEYVADARLSDQVRPAMARLWTECDRVVKELKLERATLTPR